MAKLPFYRDQERNPKQRGHISDWRVKKFLTCPYDYFLTFIEKRSPKRGRSIKLAFGDAGHQTFEKNARTKMAENRDLELQVLRDTFHTALVAEAAEVELSIDETEEFVTKRRATDALLDQGIALVDLYHDQVAPQIHPTAVEKFVRIETDGDFDIVVIIDLIEPGKVGDFKFIGKSDQNADVHYQFDIYALGYLALHHTFPEEMYLDKFYRGAKPSYERQRTKRDMNDVERYLRTAETVVDAIQKDVFPPNGLGTWKCSPRWCDHWPCEFVKGGAR